MFSVEWLLNLSVIKQILILSLLLVLLFQVEYFVELRPIILGYQSVKNSWVDQRGRLEKLTQEVHGLTRRLKKSNVLPIAVSSSGQQLHLMKAVKSFDGDFQVRTLSNTKCFQVNGLGDYSDFFELVQECDQIGMRVYSFFLKKNRVKQLLSIYLQVGVV